MLTAPYSIYVNKRPLRVAFLIEDKPESLAIIDAILAYNRDRWGGRYNPIVITDGQTLTDAASLVTPLTELSTFRAFTYPIQLCSIPKEALPPVDYDRFAEAFEVVIGDTPTDVAYFWNRPSTILQWSRTYLNQVWLPVSVATNAQLTTALSSWLQRSADPNGSYRGRIRFVSLSLSQEELQKIVEPLTRGLRVLRHVDALREIQPPRIRVGLPGPPAQDKMDLYRATGTTERLTLHEPDVLQGPMLGEHWMADLYIEFRPERYPTISGRPLWWQLPRLNVLASQMFRRPARILQNRYPSVLMKHGEPRLDISLLDDIRVFAMLAALQNRSYYTVDVRHEKTLPGRTPYYQARRSEKGRYLSGLLDLFGGLHPATSCLEERYWRRMFDLLSGGTPHTDAERLKEVGNALRKRLGANRAQFYEDDKAMTWLTNYVLKVARSLPASSRDLEFRVFEEQAKQEMEDFNARRPRVGPVAHGRPKRIPVCSVPGFVRERRQGAGRRSRHRGHPRRPVRDWRGEAVTEPL